MLTPTQMSFVEDSSFHEDEDVFRIEEEAELADVFRIELAASAAVAVKTQPKIVAPLVTG